MKIGVAFSGSGAGAMAAYAFADELRKSALKIEMMSATSLASVSSLLWAYGLPTDDIRELMAQFSAASAPEEGLDMLERAGAFQGSSACAFAVNSVDTLSGVTAVYSDALKSDAWNLKVLPLSGSERTALASTISPYTGCCPYSLDGMSLCDFSVRYGCPFFPLKMAGMEKLLSVTFAGGDSPAQVAADCLTSLTGRFADLHYTVKLLSCTDIETQVRAFVSRNIREIYDKMLF